MMKRSIHLVLLLCAICLANLSYSQYYTSQNAVWTMANLVGADFSGAQPVAITSNVVSSECSAAVSDSSGHLRFYTNGSDVWDRLGNMMPNGQNINGTGIANLTTTQGALIVPHPVNANQYFVFSLRMYLYVNLVDMSLNNGYGDIVTSYPLRGVLSTDTFGEKMVAVRGCNNNIWVVVRGNNIPAFYSFQVTGTGPATTPVVSTTGSMPANTYFQGQMVASSDGTRLATCSTNPLSRLELFKFDNTSGIVYHGEVLDSVPSYGLAFSPNGRRLYYSDFDHNFRVQQYNLDNGLTTDLGAARMTQFKLAVDGKVYFMGALNANSTSCFLGRIASPDLARTACQFEQSVPSLEYPNPPNGLSLVLGLPNEIVTVSPEGGHAPAQNRLLLDTVVCSATFSPLTLSAYPVFSNYVWNNGATGLSRIVQSAGTYWVRYNTMCGPRTDTFKITASPVPPVQLQYNAPVLSATQSYNSYQWYKGGQPILGANSATLTVTDTGWYSLKAGWTAHCTDSAAYYISGANSMEDIAAAAAIKVYPNPVTDQISVQADRAVGLTLVDINGKVLKNAVGKSLPMADLPAAVYFLHIADARSGTLLKVHKITKQ